MLWTVRTARPDRDECEAGYRQNLWMENSLRNMGNDNDADDKKNVIKL